MKRSSTSLAIRELQIKITMKNHYTHWNSRKKDREGMVNRNVIILNAKEDTKNRMFHTFLTHCWWEYKTVQTLWEKQPGSFRSKETYIFHIILHFTFVNLV